MSANAKRVQRRQSPESLELDTMKGRLVMFEPPPHEPLVGRLIWVDRYSYCLDVGTAEAPNRKIVTKMPGAMLTRIA